MMFDDFNDISMRIQDDFNVNFGDSNLLELESAFLLHAAMADMST